MLPKLEGYAAAVLEPLHDSGLATLCDDLNSLELTILSRSDLRAMLTDTSIAGVARGQVVRDILASKLGELTVRLAQYAATSAPAQEVPHTVAELAVMARDYQDAGAFDPKNLGLTEARKRVSGFADAVLEDLATDEFSSVESELFAWARTIERNEDLRRLLLDRDAPLESRLGTTQQLLSGNVHDVTLRLALYVVEGGRPRDVVGTLDFLVDYVARSRDWRVARVHTARQLDQESQAQLQASLAALTGKNVELQIAEEPALLGGVLIEVGDLRLDATTRGRLGSLHEAVTSGRFYESSLNRND